MTDRITVRLSSEEKTRLEAQAKDKGFKSKADFARYLMEKGLEAITIKKSEHFSLINTTQSVLLLREILSTISSDDNASKKTIENIKAEADNWMDKFNKAMTQV